MRMFLGVLVLSLLGCSGLGSSTASIPTPPPAPETPAGGALLGRATLEGGRLTVYNDSDAEWTNVVALPEELQSCRIGIVHKHDQGGMNLANCTGTPPAAYTRVQVTADQGSMLVSLGGSVAAPPPAAPATPAAAPPSSSSPPSSSTAPSSSAAPASPPPPAPPPAPAASGVKVHATMSGGFGPARRLTVVNDGSNTLSGCRVTVNDLYGYDMKTLAAGRDEGIMLVRFKDSAGNTFTANANITQVKLACDQGGATVTPR